jgi:hypothetical protein
MPKHKRKRAALFEVFQNESPATSSGGGRNGSGWNLRAPAWFGRGKSVEAESSLGSGPLIAPHDPTDPTTTAIERFSAMGSDTDNAPVGHSRPGVRVQVDSGDQTIKLVLSYSSAAVACFSFVVVLALAFVLGKHSGRGPLPLLADRTTDEVRKDAPRGDVLNVSAEPINPSQITPVVNRPAPGAAKQASAKQPTWNDPKPPSTLTVDDEKRTIGLNYVIVQSYPEKKDADAARDLLVKHGTLCTVEPTPEKWFINNGQQWYSVIGIKGFSKIRDSEEYDRYKATIMQISNEFAGKSRFKRFEPTPIKWRG